MKELTNEELIRVQLEIMDYIDCFCRKYDVQYTLACGTLLGAVRHGGFIPWDDDIDIHLLRSEYDKFTEIWNAHKDEHPYELVNIESGNSMGYAYGKIHDPKTVTYVGNVERTGVFIDVYPMDYVLDEDDFKVRHDEIKRLYDQRTLCLNWMSIKDSKEPLYKKAMIFLKKPRLSLNEIAEKISNLASQRRERTDYVFEMVQGMFPKHLIPSEVYDEYQDIKFEDRIYRSVKDYDTFLERTYGDYMTLPPVEKRVSHHSFKAYWRER